MGYQCSGCDGGCESNCDSGLASCKTCNTCNQCQSLCELNGQTNPFGFSFGFCIEKDKLIPQDYKILNDAISHINKVFAQGSLANGGIYLNQISDSYLTASSYNNIAKEAGAQQVQPGDLILGSYFKDLQDKLNNLQYKASQCDKCNSSCDSCDNCQPSCDSCQGCNADGSCADCCGCDGGCQSDEDKDDD